LRLAPPFCCDPSEFAESDGLHIRLILLAVAVRADLLSLASARDADAPGKECGGLYHTPFTYPAAVSYIVVKFLGLGLHCFGVTWLGVDPVHAVLNGLEGSICSSSPNTPSAGSTECGFLMHHWSIIITGHRRRHRRAARLLGLHLSLPELQERPPTPVIRFINDIP